MKYDFFAYINYRVNQWYFRWDGKRGGMGAIAVTVTQTFPIGAVLLVILTHFFDYSVKSSYSKLIGGITFGLFMILFTVNYFKYDGKYDELNEHWKSETKSQRVKKGVVIFLLIIIPIAAIVLNRIYA